MNVERGRMTVALCATRTGPGLSLPTAGSLAAFRADDSESEGQIGHAKRGIILPRSTFHVHPSASLGTNEADVSPASFGGRNEHGLLAGIARADRGRRHAVFFH